MSSGRPGSASCRWGISRTLTPFNVEELWLYSEYLLNDQAHHPITKAKASLPFKKAHFSCLYQRCAQPNMKQLRKKILSLISGLVYRAELCFTNHIWQLSACTNNYSRGVAKMIRHASVNYVGVNGINIAGILNAQGLPVNLWTEIQHSAVISSLNVLDHQTNFEIS